VHRLIIDSKACKKLINLNFDVCYDFFEIAGRNECATMKPAFKCQKESFLSQKTDLESEKRIARDPTEKTTT
jgi:hypothetical protein